VAIASLEQFATCFNILSLKSLNSYVLPLSRLHRFRRNSYRSEYDQLSPKRCQKTDSLSPCLCNKRTSSKV